MRSAVRGWARPRVSGVAGLVRKRSMRPWTVSLMSCSNPDARGSSRRDDFVSRSVPALEESAAHALNLLFGQVGAGREVQAALSQTFRDGVAVLPADERAK